MYKSEADSPHQVVEKTKRFGGTVLRTSLSHADEDKLQAALRQVNQSAT
jgi:uncharacterized membrane protein